MPPVAPVEMTTRIGRPDSESVPVEGPTCHSCPQPFRRVRIEVSESPAALEEVAARMGELAVKAVPAGDLPIVPAPSHFGESDLGYRSHRLRRRRWRPI